MAGRTAVKQWCNGDAETVMRIGRRVACGISAFGLVVLSSGIAAAQTVTGSAGSAATRMAQAAPGPLPRIAAPRTQGRGTLAEATTGRAFRPRGFNYTRLAEAPSGWFHATFEPGLYDAARAERTLAQLQHDGYTVVRVFIDSGSVPDAQAGRPHGLGHGVGDHGVGSGPYLDNVADFVLRAAAHRVYVLPVLGIFPQNEYYYGLVGNVDSARLNIESANLMYMHDGHIRAKETYVREFLTAIRSRLGSALMSTLLGLQFDNEATWRTDLRPFSRYAGTVTPANGVVYDMSKPADRQQAADASIVEYANRLTATARAVDPQLLTTMGMFTHRIVGRSGPDGMRHHCQANCGDPDTWRYPARPAVLSTHSHLDFLDLHVYPRLPYGTAYSLDEDLASSEWSAVKGIVLMGETGAYRDSFGGSVTEAAYAMRNHQVETCRRGFAGWLFWTWDTDDNDDQRRFFTASEAGGAINGQLAPVVRPDPCRS
jgi:hypothetical protein